MNPLSLFSIAGVLLVLCWACHLAEKSSRKWYEDRALLRAQGFFFALSIITLILAFVAIRR